MASSETHFPARRWCRFCREPENAEDDADVGKKIVVFFGEDAEDFPGHYHHSCAMHKIPIQTGRSVTSDQPSSPQEDDNIIPSNDDSPLVISGSETHLKAQDNYMFHFIKSATRGHWPTEALIEYGDLTGDANINSAGVMRGILALRKLLLRPETPPHSGEEKDKVSE